MQKKFLAGTILAVSLLLVGCSGGNKSVATMKGKTITQEDFYKELKDSSAGKSTLQNMVLADALEQKYGDRVSKTKVEKKYEETESRYGSKKNFEDALKNAGYTPATYKKTIRNSLLATEALKDKQPESSKKFKDALEEAWKNYSPKITVQHILVDDENTAKDVIKKYEADPTEKNFGKLAKEYSKDTSSKDKDGKLEPFDPKSTSNNLDTNFSEAAGKLEKEGDYTKEPVKYGTGNGYFIIRLINKPNKGKLKDHKTELTNQIYEQWQKDATVLNPVFGKVLKDVDAKIIDKDMEDVLSSYVGTKDDAKQSSTSK